MSFIRVIFELFGYATTWRSNWVSDCSANLSCAAVISVAPPSVRVALAILPELQAARRSPSWPCGRQAIKPEPTSALQSLVLVSLEVRPRISRPNSDFRFRSWCRVNQSGISANLAIWCYFLQVLFFLHGVIFSS